MNLQQIRDFVRGHMDLDPEDLPDAVLDVMIREGSKRVERAENRWPFYSHRWTYTTQAGVDEIDFSEVAANIEAIQSVKGPRWTLTYVGLGHADARWPENTSTLSEPTHWSVDYQTLFLWPTPNGPYELTLRGYRTPIDWVANGAGAEPDLPNDLHNTVAMWALARAYEQQDDPEMASIFERKFADEINLFRRRINDTPPAQPIVLNGRPSPGNPLRMRFDWE